MVVKFEPRTPPREFKVGPTKEITLKDCGSMALDPNEQITFVAGDNAEFDVARKDWGFYATPSLNGRLKRFGWRSALVKSPGSLYYILLVEPGKRASFDRYLAAEGQTIVAWLDDDAELARLEKAGEEARG